MIHDVMKPDHLLHSNSKQSSLLVMGKPRARLHYGSGHVLIRRPEVSRGLLSEKYISHVFSGPSSGVKKRHIHKRAATQIAFPNDNLF